MTIYIYLADLGDDWQITHPDPRIILEPFTRKVFRRIANARPRRED